jgi:hypothetical protein
VTFATWIDERDADEFTSAFGSGALPLPREGGTSGSGPYRLPAHVRPFREVGTRPAFDVSVGSLVMDVLLLGQTMIENACLHAYALDGTTTPKTFRILREARELTPADEIRGTQTFAGQLINEAQVLSGLTLEEIAPLVAVTRRSLQNWRAGEPISARKEARLRNLVDALRALSKGDSATTRQVLFDRSGGGVRAYDLLLERRFGTAIALVSGRSAPEGLSEGAHSAVPAPTAPLLARLSLRDDRPTGLEGRTDLRRSKRLKH